MKLNCYKICDEKINVGSVKVILNAQTKIDVKNTISNLRKTKTLQEISKILGVDYTTLWRYLAKKDSLPLIVLKRLEQISNQKFSQKNWRFTCGHAKKRITLPTQINKQLAKIVGAILADGHLKIRISKRGYHYELVLREEYKSNVDAFIKWVYDVFNLKLNVKKEDNHHYIYCSNKIIVLFLTSIIGIPSGKKVDIVSIPKLFKETSKNIKIALLQGIFMFDGGVDYATGYVSLISRSQKLIQDTEKILNDVNLEPNYVSKIADKYQRHKILFRKEAKLKNCLVLFEPATEKWYRLSEHFFGFKNITKDLNKLYSELDKYYPRTRKSSITFSDVVKVVVSLRDEASLENIQNLLNRKKTTLYAYLSKLTNWGILNTTRKNLQYTWRVNETLYFPRR
jgi:hypothetical protein